MQRLMVYRFTHTPTIETLRHFERFFSTGTNYRVVTKNSGRNSKFCTVRSFLSMYIVDIYDMWGGEFLAQRVANIIL